MAGGDMKTKQIRPREQACSEKKLQQLLFSLKLVFGYLRLVTKPSKKVSCKLHIIMTRL